MCELTLVEAGFTDEAITPCKPREFFTVADKSGSCHLVFDSLELANAKRVVYDHDYTTLAPHSVIRLLEMPA